MYIGYVKFVFPCTTIPYLLMSYFNYFTTDLGSDAFLLPFVMWKIFNRRTPIAYLFAFTLQFLAAAYTILVGTTLMLHVFGSIWLFMAFVYDVRTEMDGLDAYRQTEISDAKFYKHLCEFIQFHSDIKQLRHCHWPGLPANIYSNSIIFQITFTSGLYICYDFYVKSIVDCVYHGCAALQPADGTS